MADNKRHANDDLSGIPYKKVGIESTVEASTSGHSEAFQPMDIPNPRRPHAEPPDSRSSRSDPYGILTTMARSRTGPAPCHEDVYITVNSADMEGYFSSLYETIFSLLHPIEDPAAGHQITLENFILVCRYLTKSRCDNVFGKVSGRRTARRIPLPTDLLVPNALAIVINGIGVVTVDGGAYPIIPQPEAVNAVDVNQNLDVIITHAILAQFSNFVKAAANRNLIRTGFLSTALAGTAWWIITARTPGNVANIAPQDANSATIYSVIREWNPSDAQLCAIVLRQNNGLFAGMTELKWTAEPFTGIGAMRSAFNADA